MKYDLQALDAALAARIQEKKLPGVTVSIRGPEGVIFEKGYGVADDKGRAIDENTVMGIASMSKSTATLALCILASEGKCSFDDPVSKYFPNFRLKGTPQQAVTLHHLATHTAGIPPMEPLEWSIALNSHERRETDWTRAMKATSPNQMDKIDQVVDYISEGRYPTLGEPGLYMSYSNEGYAILSYVVDQAAGYPLEQFLKERVFGPMGMTRTVLDLDCSEARALAGGNITSLWEREEDGTFLCDDGWSVLPPFRACACVKSTAHDMSRYYQCLSNHGVLDGVQVIPAEAADMMVGRAFPLSEKPFYCYGLNQRLWKGHIICEHSGGLHGVSTHGGFLLGENYGFSALCNEGGQDTDDLCWIMYNMIMGQPLEEKHIWLHPTGERFAEPEMLVGEYICHEGEPVTMRVYIDENGQLMAHRPLGEYTLRHCGETWFQFVNKDGELAGRCHFWVRNGQAWGVQVYTRIYQRIEE